MDKVLFVVLIFNHVFTSDNPIIPNGIQMSRLFENKNSPTEGTVGEESLVRYIFGYFLKSALEHCTEFGEGFCFDVFVCLKPADGFAVYTAFFTKLIC